MSISFFGSASNPADNGAANEPTTLAITVPANMKAGDLVVMYGIHRLAADTITLSATGGQTWNDTGNINGTGCSIHAWWCQFNGTWGANPSLAFASESGTIPVSAIMVVFRSDVNVRWSVDTAIAGGTEASASPVVITGITPKYKENVSIAIWLVTNISTWGTIAGAGWVQITTAQFRNSAGSDVSSAVAYQIQGAAAATGDVSLIPSIATTGGSVIGAFVANPVDVGYQVNHRR